MHQPSKKPSATSGNDSITNTFELKRSVPIDALNLTVEEYEHPGTGAIHLHLASDNSENVFMVALRTVPKDSTGVAHVLEHTVLCGSERFPVRDPFFMMLKRSLSTFMNAFTSSDWTAYPFATKNRKDFNNLLSVYLDAVFFSRLDPLDFAQEGHRVEFDKLDDGRQALVYKGIVFNEMKGAMSSPSSILWDKLSYELFPANTYHHNSGGDPEVIPQLTYQQLYDFYTTHYHPSNAIFLTFGDIPATDHQQTFEALALHRFERNVERIKVNLEATFESPRRAIHPYALDSDEKIDNKTHHIIGWKLGESIDLLGMLEAQVLSAILMENSASPLMKYLETTSLGSAPSPICGVEDSMREMVFCCGIEGSTSGARDTFEQEVLDVIANVAHEGISHERIEAILHQIELHQREVTGDGMPYGLNLMLRSLGAAIHRGDAVAVLDLEPVLIQIREHIQDPNYVGNLIKRLLLENPHRITLTVEPDTSLSQRLRDTERERLDTMEATMDEQQRAQILDLTEKLKQRQTQEDDPNILPKVDPSDIPTSISEPTPVLDNILGIQVSAYTTGTNGLVYQQWIRPLPAIDDAEFERLPLLIGLMTELGVGDADYLTIQDRQSATVGAIGATLLTRSARDDLQACQAYVLLASKALANRADKQVALMHDTFAHARFDEASRIRELVSQSRAHRDRSITENGHILAMSAATAGMNPLARHSHEQSGLEGIRRLRLLDDRLRQESELESLLGELKLLHTKLNYGDSMHLATIADQDYLDNALTLATEALADLRQSAHNSHWQPKPIREAKKEYWVANTQVNFCARAFPTVPSGHPDAPLLAVLAALLRNGYLHRTIREQGGAYGGGASHDSNVGAFRFFSYRDPRLADTLDDFDAAVKWFIESKHKQRILEEAILGIISNIDKPGSPAGEAKKHFHESLFSRTTEHRAAFRAGVIEATLEDLRRVAQTYLTSPNASTVVITNAETAKRETAVLTNLGLMRRELL